MCVCVSELFLGILNGGYGQMFGGINMREAHIYINKH